MQLAQQAGSETSAAAGLLPSAVADLVQDHLPDYRRARREWPLWTYSRDSEDWGPPVLTSLAERVRWAQLAYLSVVERQLEKAAGRGLVEYTPGSETASFVAGWSHVPLAWQARIAAVFAVTAWPEIPEHIEDLRFPSAWSQGVPMDEADLSMLDGGLRDPGFLPLPPLSLFNGIVKLQTQSLKPGTKTKQERRALQRQRRELAADLNAEDLLPSNRTSGRTMLPGRILRRLEAEAREIVKEVFSYRPSEDRVELYARLRETDEAYRPMPEPDPRRGRDRWFLRRQERVLLTLREGVPPDLRALQGNERLPLFLIRFPFLHFAEIQRIWEPTSQYVRAAQQLVCSRLPGKPSSATLRRRIRHAR